MSKDVTIKEKVTFEFALRENVDRVAIALILAGYYVKVRKEGMKYEMLVYTDRL